MSTILLLLLLLVVFAGYGIYVLTRPPEPELRTPCATCGGQPTVELRQDDDDDVTVLLNCCGHEAQAGCPISFLDVAMRRSAEAWDNLMYIIEFNKSGEA